ncbi:haloacid dehalogenase-like hydrolase [Flavobacteriaceae bacterium XHP0103]|uniref:HAD family hydrolase n=1 Tax=Marixanthotalea marina TaxID=2844359 RepID=UPI002989AD8D|nr:HAD family hydrolase [Marixanthotalea marina]MBU3823021.1 haloacid dehalogenase-like hydrolase [Marixanthotalea marina]
MEKKVLVVDLDGTLYTINTFHHFLKFLLFYSFRQFKFWLSSKLLVVILLRMLRLVSHSKMKYLILKSIQKEEIDYSAFIERINKYKRLIGEVSNPDFHLKILATAAPSCYASLIAKNENFDVCLGTGFPAEEYKNNYENKGEIKKNSVLKYLRSVGVCQIDTMITDHLDDLPLMKVSSNNILYCPNQFLEEELNKNAITFISRV